MWYENSYRRHLLDMHIDDWDPSFLSEFSPEEYVKNLKTAKIQSAMIYLQSHVGLCYYPTKNGHMHKSFIGQEDKMKSIFGLDHSTLGMVNDHSQAPWPTSEKIHKNSFDLFIYRIKTVC